MFFFCSTKKLENLLKGFNHMAGEFDRLKTEVSETKVAVQAALADFKGDIEALNVRVGELIAQLADAAGDAAEVTRLADELDALQVEIAAAVAPEPTA